MFSRKNDSFLDTWLSSKQRKTLVLRGARQIGKSTAVRRLAERQNRDLIEVDLERHSQLDASFATLDVDQILQDIQLLTRKKVTENSILFFDEAQGAPRSLAALRYFYEQRPDIALVTAGSLLEFALAEHDFSMPVGRIDFTRMFPLTFSEYLSATQHHLELEVLKNFATGKSNIISESSHTLLMKLFAEYVLIGGMPAAVAESMEHPQLLDKLVAGAHVHERLLLAFRDDFSKHRKRIPAELLRKIFDTIPSLLGNVKVKYSALTVGERTESAKRGLEALIAAGLVRKVVHTPARGIPLSSGADSDIFKLLPLDIGLSSTRELGTLRTLSLPSSLVIKWESGNAIERHWMGQLAECTVGQFLLALEESHSQLFYWLREGKSANAEVDYVVQCGTTLIPIEVKSGSSGSLKSLHRFVADRELNSAVRFDINAPIVQHVEVQTLLTGGASVPVKYTLHNLPLYFSDFVFEYIRTRDL